MACSTIGEANQAAAGRTWVRPASTISSTAASTRGWLRRCSSSRSSGSPGWRPDGAVGTVMERDSATRAIVSVISMGCRPP